LIFDYKFFTGYSSPDPQSFVGQGEIDLQNPFSGYVTVSWSWWKHQLLACASIFTTHHLSKFYYPFEWKKIFFALIWRFADISVMEWFNGSYLIENTSYSTMLNIAESVPSLEPVPPNSRNSIIIQHNRSTRHWPSSIKFPEFRNRMEFLEFRAIPSPLNFRNYFQHSPWTSPSLSVSVSAAPWPSPQDKQ